MKNSIKNILILLGAAAIGAFAGCSNEFEEISDLGLTRCLEPMNLSARVVNGDLVTFNWDVTKDAAGYNLEVYYDEGMTQKYLAETIGAGEVPYTKKLEADTTFYYRVQATNTADGLQDSKWAAYDKAIRTYAVKDNLYLKVEAKTATTIDLAWSTDVADYTDVDRIEYAVVDGSGQGSHELSAEEIATGKATVDGLEPGKEYVIVLYFKSAVRGQVDVFTGVDISGYTQINSMDELRNAIKTDGAKLYLTQAGSPYTVADGETLDIPGELSIAGEEAADGSKPVIQGEFHILGTAHGSIVFESVELNGMDSKYGFTVQLKNGGGIKDDVVLDEISFRNCVITGYSKGLIYEWGQPMNVGKLCWDSCDINNINSDGTGGGDVIDFRGTAEAPLSTIGELDIINNTIYQGMRTFIRLDFLKGLGTVKVENNTMWNLCVSDNTNNAGLVAIQTIPVEMNVRKNLVLSMGEKSKLGGDNAASGGFDGFKYWHGFGSADNWYYSVSGTFFNTAFTDAGFTKLDADPCFNAPAGLFNLTNSDLVAAKVGASKWWTAYVEEPEDLTLGTVTGNHVWDFGNAKYFSGTIKKEMVRDLLYINASGDNPITVNGGALDFAAATVTNKKGVPSSGYLAFKVAEPGSVVIKVSGETDAHATVAAGPVDGSSITIKGGAAAIAESSVPTKIVISDITEECMVYVYVSGATTISELAWSTDLSAVNTALPAPQPTAEPSTVTAGDATDIVVSWEAVPNAGSYSVVFNEKTYPADEGACTYTLGATTVSMLDPGSYTVKVYANPGEDDIYNTMSEAGTAAFAVLPKAEEGGQTGTLVKNLEQFNSALAAGKDDIILAGDGTFDFSSADTKTITPATPTLRITGQDGATVTGAAFNFAGSDCSEFILENVTMKAGDQGILLNFDAAGATMSSIKLIGVTADGYAKSIIYGNSDANNIDEVVFKGLMVLNQGTGQGMFDFRKGAYGTVQVTESTLTGGRDFFRMDAGVVNGVVDISKNTMYNLNSSNNGNGIFYVRSTSTTEYTVKDNLIHTLTSVLGKKNTAVLFPTFSNNFYYGMGPDVFTGQYDEATATAGNGVVLTADPVRNAAANDFTLTSGLAMSNKVGDPRWNPSYDGGAADSFIVKSKDEFDAAIGAGKTEITLAAEGSPYDLSASPTILVAGLRLSGEVVNGKRPQVTLPQLDLKGELGSIIFEDLDITGPGSGGGTNFFSTGGVTLDKLIVKNCDIKGFQKSILYGNSDADAIGAVSFSNVNVSDLGGGQGTFDLRKGVTTSLTIENSTFVGGRDFLRADKGTVTGSISVTNNTMADVCGSQGNGNGILHVRAVAESFVFKNNLVMYPELSTRVFAKAGDEVPQMAVNMFYNTDEATYWAGAVTKDQATANGGAVLPGVPVKDLAGGDYTLTDALCLGSNVGDPDWNPNAGTVTTDITVASVEEFQNAVSAGKTAITLKYGDYDFRTEGNSNGDITLEAGITIVGEKKAGACPTIHGALQLKTGITTLVLKNLKFDGRNDAGDATIGVALNIASAISADKVLVEGCEFVGYAKSLLYANQDGTALGTATFNDNLVHGFGTGQGIIDIRKGTIGTLVVSNSTFYDGGRDFLRCDKEIAGSISVKNNTFAACSVGAGNGLLWVRSCAADPGKYTVAKNLFVNITGSSLLAKTGATVPEMSDNFFYNVAEGFFTGAIDQASATGNGGAVLTGDPCTNSAEFSLKVTDAAVKAAGAGDPRWL